VITIQWRVASRRRLLVSGVSRLLTCRRRCLHSSQPDDWWTLSGNGYSV